MYLSTRAKRFLGLLTFSTLSFIYLPLVIVAINSFNPSKTFSWPPKSFSTMWWSRIWESEGVLPAIYTSIKVGLGATAIALVLGTCIALAVSRYSFYGKNTVSLLVIFPIALPGIITGIALNTTFHTFLDPLNKELAIWTVVVGHATFCIVVVYNNVLARLRRLGQNLEEASQDLGANIFQTFRYVTFPLIRSALAAGGLLAFALSFDEIVVTTFTAGPGTQTLPQWIFNNLFRPNQAPIVNVVATLLILLFIFPVWLSQRISHDGTSTKSARH
jgi:putative spermidine/putrescine transport system permease protein